MKQIFFSSINLTLPFNIMNFFPCFYVRYTSAKHKEDFQQNWWLVGKVDWIKLFSLYSMAHSPYTTNPPSICVFLKRPFIPLLWTIDSFLAAKYDQISSGSIYTHSHVIRVCRGVWTYFKGSLAAGSLWKDLPLIPFYFSSIIWDHQEVAEKERRGEKERVSMVKNYNMVEKSLF